MHFVLVAILMAITWKWADWKGWTKYHSTMLFAALGGLLYNFLYKGHYLWQMKSGIMRSSLIDLAYTFIVFPATVLLFLSNYPDSFKGKIIHYIKYITVYIALEWIFYITGRLVYNNGWNMLWSLFWDFIMFPIWALHHKKPLAAYGVALMIVIAIITIFPVKI